MHLKVFDVGGVAVVIVAAVVVVVAGTCNMRLGQGSLLLKFAAKPGLKYQVGRYIGSPV